MSIKTTLRLEADALARKLARYRWGGRCAVCGMKGNEVHHLIGRSHMATRYAPENLILLCANCHRNDSTLSAERTPYAFLDWLHDWHGFLWNWRRDHRNDMVTATVPWYREQIERLKATLERLEIA